MNSKKFKRLCEQYNQRKEEKERREAVGAHIVSNRLEKEGEDGRKKESDREW